MRGRKCNDNTGPGSKESEFNGNTIAIGSRAQVTLKYINVSKICSIKTLWTQF